MSTVLNIPIPPNKLARKAWMRVAGLLLLGLLGATALAFYGYQIHRLSSALNTFKDADSQYHRRAEAIRRLSDMETAFNRFLLDANSANLGLMEANKQRIEQLAQQDANAQNDQLLQNLVAAEKKWYSETVQPMVEERRKLAAGQGLPEELLVKYRSTPQDLQLVNSEVATENAHRQAQETLQQTQEQIRWLWVPIPLAALLALGVIWVTAHTMKSVNHLKLAAESGTDEEEADEEDGQLKRDHHEEAS